MMLYTRKGLCEPHNPLILTPWATVLPPELRIPSRGLYLSTKIGVPDRPFTLLSDFLEFGSSIPSTTPGPVTTMVRDVNLTEASVNLISPVHQSKLGLIQLSPRFSNTSLKELQTGTSLALEASARGVSLRAGSLKDSSQSERWIGFAYGHEVSKNSLVSFPRTVL